MNKVFFIGFNKTGTTSIHNLFVKTGYRSLHYATKEKEKFLALVVANNFNNGEKLLTGIENFDAYSDFNYIYDGTFIESASYFKTLDEQYPNSYFILQTRDEKDWLNSRLKHVTEHGEYYADIVMKTLKLDKESLIRQWQDTRRRHHRVVESYFKDYEKFIKFDIDSDNISKLVDFLSDDYLLNAKHWKTYNVTKE